jgi:hypothetical protein
MLACPLCEADGGEPVFSNQQLRATQASEAGFPAFHRVIWTAHVAELSDTDVNRAIFARLAV